MKVEGLRRPNRFYAFILVLVSLVVFFANLGGRNFWDPDETRYAEVSHEMLADGHWLLPHLNGQPYPDKPPLFFWLTASLCAPFHHDVHEVPARLVSAVSALGIVLLIFLLGKAFYNARTGFLAGLVLASMFRFFWQSHWLQIDMALAFFETASVFFLWRAAQSRRPMDYVLAYGAAACAVLSKGPVGFLPLAAFFLFAVLQKEKGFLRKLYLGRGLALVSGLTLLWLVSADLWGGEPYSALAAFRRHVVERSLHGLHHVHPWHFFFGSFSEDILPWTFFLLAALWESFRHERGEPRRKCWFLGAWFGLSFLVFSLSKEKRALYLLPILPPAALWIGRFFERASFGFTKRKAWQAPAWASAALLGGGGLWLFLGGAEKISARFPVNFEVALWPLTALLLMGALLCGASAFFRRGAAYLVYGLVGWGIVASLLLHYVYAPSFNLVKSPVPFSERVASVVSQDTPLGMYHLYRATYHFYLHRKVTFLDTPEDLSAFFGKHPEAFCLVPQKLMTREPLLSEKLETLFCERIGARTMCLVRPLTAKGKISFLYDAGNAKLRVRAFCEKGEKKNLDESLRERPRPKRPWGLRLRG